MNRLKAKEAVWKYVRFLEPSIWQRQRPNKAADSCTNNWFVESKFGFFRTGELHCRQVFPNLITSSWRQTGSNTQTNLHMVRRNLSSRR